MVKLIYTHTTQIQHDDTTSSPFMVPISQVFRITIWVLFLWAGGMVLHRIPPAIATVIVLVTLVPAVVFFWNKPVYGIIALIFFASGFLEPDFIDIRLPIVGGFEMRDILVLMLFGLMLIQRLHRKHLPIPFMPVGLFMGLFFCVVCFSLGYAIFFENVAMNWALGDARILSFYLLFFIVPWAIRDEKSLLTLIIACFVIADLTASIVILQQQLGANNLLLSSMRDGSWQVVETASTVRVVPPGILLMYFMNFISLGLTLYINRGILIKGFLLLHSMFLTLALIFTYTRSAWVASGIALVIMLPMTLYVFRRHLLQIITISFATLLFVIGFFGLVFENTPTDNKIMMDVLGRFDSIFTVEDTLNSNSLQWRLFESQEATKAIREYPLTGVGLGNSYRPLTVFQGEANGLWTDHHISYDRIDRFTRYVHSSYLAITVKMGLPGIILLLLVFASAILKSFGMFLQLDSRFAQALTIAIIAGFVGMLQWSILHAHLLLASSTAINGLLLGVLAAIHTIYIMHPVQKARERVVSRSTIQRSIDYLKATGQTQIPSNERRTKG